MGSYVYLLKLNFWNNGFSFLYSIHFQNPAYGMSHRESPFHHSRLAPGLHQYENPITDKVSNIKFVSAKTVLIAKAFTACSSYIIMYKLKKCLYIQQICYFFWNRLMKKMYTSCMLMKWKLLMEMDVTIRRLKLK